MNTFQYQVMTKNQEIIVDVLGKPLRITVRNMNTYKIQDLINTHNQGILLPTTHIDLFNSSRVVLQTYSAHCPTCTCKCE